jgi:hypothetical protein
LSLTSYLNNPGYSTLVNVTSIEGTHSPLSSRRSWRAVWILPPSVKTAVVRVASPFHVQVSPVLE